MTVVFMETKFSTLNVADRQLISIGLVDESGDREFYAELPEVLWRATLIPLIQHHVVPNLGGEAYILQPLELATRMREWFEALDGHAQIVCGAPNNDLEMLNGVFKDNWPRNLSTKGIWFYSMNLGRETQEKLESVWESYFSSMPHHHALRDAHALRMIWDSSHSPKFAECAQY